MYGTGAAHYTRRALQNQYNYLIRLPLAISPWQSASENVLGINGADPIGMPVYALQRADDIALSLIFLQNAFFFIIFFKSTHAILCAV